MGKWWGGDDDGSNPISSAAGGVSGTINKAKSGDISGAVYRGGKTAFDPAGITDQARSQGAKALGWDRSKQKELGDESARTAEEEWGARQGVLGQMSESEKKYREDYGKRMDEYLGQSKAYGNTYRDNLNRNQQQARDQAQNAQTVYTNDIQPRLKSTMEDAQREANSAMSLSDAGDPNSAYQQKIRGMYDQMAQGEQKQGVADFGVLSALGAQATQNTMGAGGPMTGAQLQLLGAQNQQQASQAYQAARRRMDNLKQQGIERGFDESSKQYERGQAAKDRYRQSVGDYEGGMDRNIGRQGRFRTEDMDIGRELYGHEQGMADREYGGRSSQDSLSAAHARAGQNRELSQLDALYGNKQAGIANQMAEANAENAAKSQMAGGILQAGATAAGAYYGGGQGAAAGSAAGGGVGQGMQAQQPSRAQNMYYGAQTGNMIGGSVAGGMQPQQPGFAPQRRQYQYA